jgi:hydroxypyruvate isomerase
MRFCPNVAMLFAEADLLERFDAAADAGFGAVECWWPGADQMDAVVARVRASGVEVVRFALDYGDPDAGDAGLLCHPDRVDRFRAGVADGLALARELGCRMVSALVGTQEPSRTRAEQLAHGQEQLAWLADQAAPEGVTVLIEANTDKVKPGFLLRTTSEAAAFVEGVGRDNVALIYDTFHVQRGEGDLTTNLRRYRDLIAHVQLGDAPERHEPGTGEIRFAHLAEQLVDIGYEGYLGLEYQPSGSTLDSLRWLPEHLRSAELGPAELAQLSW